jgi:hypothetical protein
LVCKRFFLDGSDKSFLPNPVAFNRIMVVQSMADRLHYLLEEVEIRPLHWIGIFEVGLDGGGYSQRNVR